jgi:hypothetical protein
MDRLIDFGFIAGILQDRGMASHFLVCMMDGAGWIVLELFFIK